MTIHLSAKVLCESLCILLVSMNSVLAAQVVGAEKLLCTNGYSSDNSTCTTYTTGSCDTDYIEFEQNPSTFIGVYENKCQISTYKKTSVPDTLIALRYNGILSGDETLLCTNGYSSNNSTCTSYAVHDCNSGYYEQTSNHETFIGVYDNKCAVATYKKKSVPNTTVVLTYRGMVSGSETLLCSNGYSSNNSTCTNYASGYCWTGYYDMNLGATTFSEQTNGACASNTHSFTATACGYAPTTETCLDVCGDGQMYTGVGTCASLCEMGVTTFRTSTGLVIPMWSTKQITPSINIGINNSVCYVNLEPGTTSVSAVMIQYDDTIYHTTN